MPNKTPGFFEQLQNPKSNTNRSVMAFSQALGTSVEGDYSSSASGVRAGGAFLQGFAASGGDPFVGTAMGVISLIGSSRARKKQRRRERQQRLQQVQRVSDLLRTKGLEARQSARQQELRYGSEIADLTGQIQKGAGQYDRFLGEGVSSISSERKKASYRTSSQSAITSTYSDIGENINRLMNRQQYLSKQQSRLRGSDDLNRARSALSGYSDLLEGEFA